MPLTRKQIISIAVILVIAAILGFLMYLAFFKKPAPITPPPEEEVAPTGLPEVGPAGEREPVTEEVSGFPPSEIISEPAEPAAEVPSEIASGGPTRVNSLTEEETLNPSLLSDGSLSYYNSADSKFYKITSDGEVRELSGKEFFNVQNVNWSSSGDRAILEYPDGSKLAYDFENDRQYTLAKEWQDFSFNSSGNRIAFKHLTANEENNWLATANFDGSDISLIEPLGENAAKVQVNFSPTGQIIASHWKSLDSGRQEIFFIGQHEENFKSLTVAGHNFKSKWTPDGQKLVYSIYESTKGFIPNLWVVNALGEDIGTNHRDLGLNTWIDKCALSEGSEYAYCAVPQEMPPGAGLYPELTYDIPDDFYRLNLRTGAKELLAKPSGDYTADQVILSPSEDKLYFRDINTGRLHEIRLK